MFTFRFCSYYISLWLFAVPSKHSIPKIVSSTDLTENKNTVHHIIETTSRLLVRNSFDQWFHFCAMFLVMSKLFILFFRVLKNRLKSYPGFSITFHFRRSENVNKLSGTLFAA